jgi:hypothetical protein
MSRVNLIFPAAILLLLIDRAIQRFRNDDHKDFENRSN